ncbi:MAG: LuxR C-terminal-related transcriptional regulator [Xanthomonadaceae bacterium]|nr:LuxR C-terminal-related transcriptional regulator [Xanthomonadaceae bacterium]
MGNNPTAIAANTNSSESSIRPTLPAIRGLTTPTELLPPPVLSHHRNRRDPKKSTLTTIFSEKTVRNHLIRIFEKLGVSNRAQAIVVARDSGFRGS